jgi:anti-anti-sigma regulatory factor
MPEIESPGHAIAAALAGSWLKSPPKSRVTTQDVARIVPLLLKSGAGALGWWRFRDSGERLLPAVRSLRETYLQYAIHAVDHERQLANAFRVLRSGGVEPILIKGWAIARSYPEAGLRPSGDIDLYVSPEQDAKARSVLKAGRPQQYWVDLDHDEVGRFSDFSFAELFGRSELVNLDGTEIRVMGAEDHLRILCLHLLKHGAWRPLWLCDVGAALESRLPDFDWDRCFGRNKRRADWIACTIGLANRLLGAALGDATVKNRTNRLPGWFISSVLKQWDAPYPPNLHPFAYQFKASWWKPDILTVVHQRWPNPIQATVDANGRFDNTPRLPFQLRDCIVRAVKLCLPS